MHSPVPVEVSFGITGQLRIDLRRGDRLCQFYHDLARITKHPIVDQWHPLLQEADRDRGIRDPLVKLEIAVALPIGDDPGYRTWQRILIIEGPADDLVRVEIAKIFPRLFRRKHHRVWHAQRSRGISAQPPVREDVEILRLCDGNAACVVESFRLFVPDRWYRHIGDIIPIGGYGLKAGHSLPHAARHGPGYSEHRAAGCLYVDAIDAIAVR